MNTEKTDRIVNRFLTVMGCLVVVLTPWVLPFLLGMAFGATIATMTLTAWIAYAFLVFMFYIIEALIYSVLRSQGAF